MGNQLALNPNTLEVPTGMTILLKLGVIAVPNLRHLWICSSL